MASRNSCYKFLVKCICVCKLRCFQFWRGTSGTLFSMGSCRNVGNTDFRTPAWHRASGTFVFEQSTFWGSAPLVDCHLWMTWSCLLREELAPHFSLRRLEPQQSPTGLFPSLVPEFGGMHVATRSCLGAWPLAADTHSLRPPLLHVSSHTGWIPRAPLILKRKHTYWWLYLVQEQFLG